MSSPHLVRGPVACAVVAALLSGCGGGAKHATSTQAPPETRTNVSPATTSGGGAPPPGPAGGPVPAGFEPLSFTAVSDDDYWVLGSVPCAGGRCASVVRTADGGGTFVAVPAPQLPVTGAAATAATLRFTDRRDGFAFVSGPGSGGIFATTHDGGTTWHQLVFDDVLAFATGGGTVSVVTADCSSGACSSFRLRRSPVATDSWSTSALPFTPDGPVLDLAAHGSSVWLLGTPSNQQSSQSDELARSTDGGQTFVTGPGPCVPGLGGWLAPTSADVVWAVCPTGMMAGAWRSTDGGVTFAPVATPELVNSALLAPASENTAVLAGNGAASRLLQTTDGGTTWTAAATPGTATSWLWVEFTDEKVGAALVQTGYDQATKTAIEQLWRTTDGGADWSRVQFG